MEKFKELYAICLSERNIRALIDIIREEIMLSEKSVPKCAQMIREIMKKNIPKLTRPPKNKEELKNLCKYLNKLCYGKIVEVIIKKYPDSQIHRKVQTSREQMKRDIDVYGQRENYVPDRPYTRGRREREYEENFYNMRPNDTGISGQDNGGTYASAFGDHLITNIIPQQSQIQSSPTFPNQPDRKDSSRYEQQYQQMINDRNYNGSQIQRPPTPDFTLDGSGDRVRQEKMKRQMDNNQMAMQGTGSMNNGMLSGMFDANNNMNDPYASLLAMGAPGVQPMQNTPFMGMGNPLMPTPSTNNMSQQWPSYDNNNSGKSMQLQSDFEKKLAERDIIDRETNQPINNNSNINMYGNQMASMPSYQNMQMPNMVGQPMANMVGQPMPNMVGQPMSNMPVQSMTNQFVQPMQTQPMNNYMQPISMPNMSSYQNMTNVPTQPMPSYQNMPNMANMANMPITSMPSY